MYPHYKTIKIGNISTSKKEIIDLIKSWLAISLAFAILFTADIGINLQFFYALIFSAITAGFGFLLHELAHKVVAQRYGCFAEFRSFDQMLVLAIVMSFFGVVFAAPGAVFITGPVGKRRNGIISAAGPITNIILALIFLLLGLSLPGNPILKYGFIINSWLALFNMIPFGNFDGAKIWLGNKIIYITIVMVSLIFMLLQAVI